MNKAQLNRVAREAERIADRKPGTITPEGVQRVIDGDRTVSHPVCAAIMAVLDREAKPKPVRKRRKK